MNITCTRRLGFSAGHRILGHTKGCGVPHGHNYEALITCQTPEGLNDLGMVIDFGMIKNVVGKWIDENWDHGFLVQDHDRVLWDANERAQAAGEHWKFYTFPSPPTAETIATELLRVAGVLLKVHKIRVTCVRIIETENCWAEAVAS